MWFVKRDDMAEAAHPAASHHLPLFITAPGESDVLMIVMGFILAGAVLGFGILFLRLHTLPERIAHRGHKLQFEIVAVLGLIALFTHMHIFWIAGLLLALIDLPDFGTPLNRIAGSAERMAGLAPGEGASEVPLDEHANIQQAPGKLDPKSGVNGDGSIALATDSEMSPGRPKEPAHA
jgi:hypothetical protein